ncbi:hypothetical protein CDAR_213751 [Caerostris darwini]|uniref:Uncharacterized protein n=1 Tax=Caerostris darwini TaxID=1538125 RepID=A0AAV4X2I3_9ARAC|nr:hypothetical protein CDAR_213751 [Caerostris darwini]
MCCAINRLQKGVSKQRAQWPRRSQFHTLTAAARDICGTTMTAGHAIPLDGQWARGGHPLSTNKTPLSGPTTTERERQTPMPHPSMGPVTVKEERCFHFSLSLSQTILA